MSIVVFVTYLPNAGRRDDLLELLAGHRTLLKSKGLIDETPDMLLAERDGPAIVEVFAWRDEASSRSAHEDADIWALWERLGACAEMAPMAEVEQAKTPFAHFEHIAHP
jgi:hypothetical protein